MLQLDAGDMLFGRPSVAPQEEQQRKIKGELLIEASVKLGVHALTPGEGDLVFGADWLTSMATKHGAPYVSANVVRSDSGVALFPATRVVDLGGRRIGLTGVTGATVTMNEARADDPAGKLGEAVAALKAQKVDLIVVVAHTGTDGAQELAAQVPGIDMMFVGHSRRHQEDPLIVGTTAIFEAGSRGKHVGELRIDFTPGGVGWSDPAGRERATRLKEQMQKQVDRYQGQIDAEENPSAKKRLERVREFTQKKIDDLQIPPGDGGSGHRVRGRRVPMNRAIVDQPALAALVDSYLALLGPGNTGNAVTDAMAKAGVSPTVRTDYGDYVGAPACAGCHQAEHADWMRTPHSRAYASLVKDQRHFDLECWSCHVTGAGTPGGPTSPADVGPMRSVQCESCHGPGKKHVASTKAIDIVRSPAEATCLACHTEEQTEGRFVHSEYLLKVDHR